MLNKLKRFSNVFRLEACERDPRASSRFRCQIAMVEALSGPQNQQRRLPLLASGKLDTNRVRRERPGVEGPVSVATCTCQMALPRCSYDCCAQLAAIAQPCDS